MTRTVFVDTETTGLRDWHVPWEFGGLVRDDPTGLDQPFLFCVRPDLAQADPEALAVGRYYQRTGRLRSPSKLGGDQLYDLARHAEGDELMWRWSDPQRLARHLAHEFAGAVLVGSNVQFDTRKIGKFLTAHNQSPSWHYRPVDVGALAWGHLHGRVAELDAVAAAAGVATGKRTAELAAALELPWSTSKLAAALGVPEPAADQRHTALGNARFARDLFDAVVGGRSG